MMMAVFEPGVDDAVTERALGNPMRIGSDGRRAL
jgi:hypothetical protein